MSLKDIRNLDYTILLCEDVAKMRDFYRNVLGFKIDEYREDWVKFQVGSGYLTLRPRGRWYDGAVSGDGAKVQLSFRVSPEGVNTAHQELLENSVEVLEPPTDQSFGHRTLYFKDPEGNILEIYAEL